MLNLSSTHDRLQGIRTTRVSEETCAQIATAGEPSQLERVADSVRHMSEGPHCSGDADAYEPVPFETVVNPDLLWRYPREDSSGGTNPLLATCMTNQIRLERHHHYH